VPINFSDINLREGMRNIDEGRGSVYDGANYTDMSNFDFNAPISQADAGANYTDMSNFRLPGGYQRQTLPPGMPSTSPGMPPGMPSAPPSRMFFNQFQRNQQSQMPLQPSHREAMLRNKFASSVGSSPGSLGTLGFSPLMNMASHSQFMGNPYGGGMPTNSTPSYRSRYGGTPSYGGGMPSSLMGLAMRQPPSSFRGRFNRSMFF
jgi:hypothetical protein